MRRPSSAHAARQPRYGRRILALLVLAAVTGALTGGVLAGWRDDIELSANVEVGYVHYAVGDPADGPMQDESTFTDTDGDPGWKLPASMLGDLTPATPQTAVVQIDGYTQGNRGLRYRLDGVEVESDNALLDGADLRIVQVDDPAKCDGGTLDAEEPLYDGAASGASFEDRELVAPGALAAFTATGAWKQHSLTHYLCLGLSLPDLTYTNTARVSAVVPGNEHYKVTGSDTWSATIEPTQAQQEATVTLRFPYETYRDGDEADLDLLAVEIVHTNPQATYSVGDRLAFTYRVTNLTDTARSTALFASNLAGDGGCKWENHSAGVLMDCSFGYHVVTADDVARGTFTPTATWTIHSGVGYPGILSSVSVTGGPLLLPSN